VVVLGVGLARRTGGSLWPAALGRIVVVAALVGTAVWIAAGALLDGASARLVNLVVVSGLGLAGAGAVLVGYRVLGVRRALSTRVPVPPPGAAAEASA
jgi:hypothetical protein